ncbi:phosphoglycerate mutase-like protein [Atractiella rhizophila]|nr:phosphoglycerate mutase-like protein [Atractiella rhizophila]
MSTRRLGEALRKLYVDELGFLPPAISDEGIVTFRSTPMPRTIESLQQIIRGLVPHERQVEAGSSWIPKVVVRDPMEESLYPNTICAKLRKMESMYASAAAQKWEPELAKLDDKIAKYTEGPLRIDSSPRASGVLDTMACCRAHGLPVPPEFEDPVILETLERGISEEWFGGYDASPEFKRISMGRLVGDLQSTLERKIANREKRTEDPLKVAVYALHDTSICGILHSLNCYDKKWPAFTSHIGLELFSRPHSSTTQSSFLSHFIRPFSSTPAQEYFVRVRFNSKPLKIPACQPNGKHLEGSQGYVCTFEAFKEAIKDVVMTAEEWEKACSGGVGGHRG